MTGLYYLNARYYDPEDGAFLSQDTYRGSDTDYKSWNLYAYCAGNPVNYVDVSGHESVGLKNPPGGKTGFIPKGKPHTVKTNRGKGWIDKHGNVWVSDKNGHGGAHWDVQGKNGQYVNVYPDGKTRPGKGKISLKKLNKKVYRSKKTLNSNVYKNVAKGAAVVAAAIVVYQAGKWTVAALLAPETGGGSLILAGVTP